jgi:hypothetical protein
MDNVHKEKNNLKEVNTKKVSWEKNLGKKPKKIFMTKKIRMQKNMPMCVFDKIHSQFPFDKNFILACIDMQFSHLSIEKNYSETMPSKVQS